MGHSEGLAQRIRLELQGLPGLTEKKMFGGIGFMLHGNLACGVQKEDLIVRVGPDRYAEALEYPEARPFDSTGRSMTGWVVIPEASLSSQQSLREWLRWCVDFTATLPQK
jgi:TfoX/Sxy family transcriptional regulator of competence genes